ncbi:MAG: DNA repair protein RadA [Calditrichia bacterium]
MAEWIYSMAKPRTFYHCEACGYQSPKWVGKCPDCGEWNTFVEAVSETAKTTPLRHSQNQPVFLSQLEKQPVERVKTGIGELDRVLGDGLVPASVVLIAGDPGIGKSTLLLQMAGNLVKAKRRCFYISGEESVAQIHNRASRLGVDRLDIPLLAETELENILHHIEQQKPEIVIIDSIQSLFSNQISGAPGQISQVRECTARLFHAAKSEGWTLFIVGHITKDGSIAGPKLLEHTVDVVINFEGEHLNQYRIIRSQKNRFGATNEIGLFLMEATGLKEVKNPSRLFLSQHDLPQVGTSVVCSFEGTRPILAEVQALVSRSNYGVPQRTVSGFDHRRLALLLAILEKHCGLNFGYHDVFIKIAAGLRIDDPGIDLGIATAIYSSLLNTESPLDAIYLGEIGLNGDVRPVSQLEKRVQEAIKLGFKQIFLPAVAQTNGLAGRDGVKLHFIKHVSELIQGKGRHDEHVV